ncbi:MAG: PAS domain-containing protein [Campylobacterales bacterium]|nr:PAS domain-containing protein [Campylobacterales bacterium]
MTEIIRIVYVTDWVYEKNSPHISDPFYDILKTVDAHVTIQGYLPHSFYDIDLLILHPTTMTPNVFDTISISKAENPDIKTVVISSAHGSDLFLQAIDVGVDKYLLKPLLPSAVKKVAERLVQHSLEKKQAQKAFKQINLMFDAISKTTLLVRMHEDGTIIDANDRLLKLLEYSNEDLLNFHWMRFVERRFWIYLRSIIRKQLEAGEIYRGTIELITSKGNSIMVDATIYAIRSGHGAIEEIVFIGQDVSETNRAILASMEQLIDQDSSLAILFNHRHEAILTNRSFLQLNGYTNSEEFFASSNLWEWMVENHDSLTSILSKKSSHKGVFESIFSLIRQGEIQDRIVSMDLNSNKHYYTVHKTSMPNPMIRSEKYHILYFVDVTHLERLKEEKLSDAKLMVVGRLAAAITHEINTPITYIKGNLELLKWECEEKIPDASDFFQPIEEGIERIQSIVNSMYEFAGTGKEIMKPCNVYMTLIYSLRIILNRAKHIVPITINGELFSSITMYNNTNECLTMGISTRLEQVWIIIINNALDEFEKNTLTYDKRHLDISLTCTQKEINIKIIDNAGGIPESMIESIFDFAIGGEKKMSMGIGLNVAKAIVDKHGGDIHVSNQEGGALFEITLKTYQEEK